jgi:hypothetical protein
MSEHDLITCPGCGGRGHWETECCSGAGGCDCRGQVIDMGPCNVCGGSGYVAIGHHDKNANRRAIEGLCFIGSGPSSGLWAGMGARGYKKI